jgi:hypothetical protein
MHNLEEAMIIFPSGVLMRPRCPISGIVCVGFMLDGEGPLPTGNGATLYLSCRNWVMLPSPATPAQKLTTWSWLIAKKDKKRLAHICEADRIAIMEALAIQSPVVDMLMAAEIVAAVDNDRLSIGITESAWGQ